MSISASAVAPPPFEYTPIAPRATLSMPRPTIKLLVTDLDNTLYDWVGYFAKAFRAMVEEALPLLGVHREELLDQLQAVHRRHHDSERPFSLAETEAARSRWPDDKARKELDDAFHAFNRIRKRELALYPTVGDTLTTIKRRCAKRSS